MSNNKFTILLVEDDPSISAVITAILEASSYQVVLAGTCSVANTLFASHRPDVVILDLGLPDMDGMCFLKHTRETSLTPIIVLSARSDDKDKVAALDAGANDYVTKPFSSSELLARIRAALRSNGASSRFPGERFSVYGLMIDYDARRVFLHGAEVKLSQTEYNILAYLSEHCGKMLTYSSIIRHVWGDFATDDIKKLQVNMANIRRKFGVIPGMSWCISNELGVGYRMNDDKGEN